MFIFEFDCIKRDSNSLLALAQDFLDCVVLAEG